MTDPTPPESSLVLKLDMEKYLSQLEGWEHVTEEQKQIFICTLWDILRNFADIGFEIHPTQLAQKTNNHQENKGKKPHSVLHSRPSRRTKKNRSVGLLPAPQKRKESRCQQDKH